MGIVLRQTLIAVVFGLALLGISFRLSRAGQMMSRFSLAWAVLGLSVLLSGLFVTALPNFSTAVGLTPASIGFAAVFVVLIAVTLEVTRAISNINATQKKIGQHTCIERLPERDPVRTNASTPLVVIPALNEEESIAEVIQSCQKAGFECLVIDDGSTDRTAEIALEANAFVLSAPFNLGIGLALQRGFQWALSNGYESVVQCDADGQHLPEHIHDLIEIRNSTRSDLVVGSRFAGENHYPVSSLRKFVMRVLARRATTVCGSTITDASSGFRLISGQLLNEFARVYPPGYMDSYIVLMAAGRAGYRVGEVFTPMNPRLTGAASETPLRAALHTLKALSAGVLGTRIIYSTRVD